MKTQPDRDFVLVTVGVLADGKETEGNLISDHVVDATERPRVKGERLSYRIEQGVLDHRSEMQVSRLPHSEQTALSFFQS